MHIILKYKILDFVGGSVKWIGIRFFALLFLQ